MNHPENEKEILEFWNIENIFEKSLEKNSKDNKFVFYEGPPTANGKPGIHHVLARAFKDIVCRYKTMRGFYVKRRAGWDTHGLPVEIEVEKSLGISGKKQIEDYGVAEFNKKCQESVWKYKEDWEKLTERIGFWVDLKNPYITYENSYIEKVWEVIKKVWEKDLIYSGYKVVPYCPRCGTTLSSHEVAQGYKNIEEESIYVKFKIKGEDKYFLVWTTTPWTLPGNIALAIGDLDYVEIENNGDHLILAKERLNVIDGEYKIVKELKAQEIEGLEYEPLFNEQELINQSEKNFQVYIAKFVSTEEGSGIVHIAPAFGEDDMNLQNEKGFSVPMTVAEDGTMLGTIGKGKFVKEADTDIKEDLAKRKLLYKKENIKHDYPFCWRCDSVLIYYAKETLFIAMSKLRDKLIKNNEDINWTPAYIKEGRFGEWLKEIKDWAISRERYWGTPMPIWKCECGKNHVIGSFKELQEKAVEKISDDLDLHKPFIDEVKIKCDCGKEAKRVPEVLDVWFDSGSMPFSSGEFPDFYPADYISEAIDQTRGWFYTMLAIATLMDQKSSYKNVVCLAHVLDDKGKKMSKSKGNIINPWEVIDQYGTDSLRWYFYTVNNPGEPKRMSDKSVEIAQRKFINILWNVYLFFETYSQADGWKYKDKNWEPKEILDKWITSFFNKTIKGVEEKLDKYDITGAAREIEQFNTDLSTWYLRRSRKRRDDDFYMTMCNVLINLSKIAAPMVPFISETIYRNLKTVGPESVHLCDWPKAGEIDEKLLNNMQDVRKLVEQAHAIRADKKIKVRQPLASASIKKELEKDLREILKEEINVKEILIDNNLEAEIILDVELTDELLEEGKAREFIRQIQDARKKASLSPDDKVNILAKLNEKDKEIFEKNKNEILSLTNILKADIENEEGESFVFEVKNEV